MSNEAVPKLHPGRLSAGPILEDFSLEHELQDIREGVFKDFADEPDRVLEKLGDGLMALSFRSIEPGIRSGRKF